MESLVEQILLSNLLQEDPTVQKAFKKFSSHSAVDLSACKAKAQEKFDAIKKASVELLKSEGTENDAQVKIYIDGCYDLIHAGHYNAIRQAKLMGDWLCVGVNSDADILKTKGPSIMDDRERCEIVSHCKFIDDVLSKAAYTPTFEILKSVDCGFYAHGDDPCIDSEGVDVTAKFREKNMYKEFARTPGVSTTDVTAKLLKVAELSLKAEETGIEVEVAKDQAPPKQNFLATSRRIINFANTNVPKANDTIVYIQGSWDLLHHGHLKRLEAAKKLGDFLYVGIWDDEMTRYYKGQQYPIVSLQERVLMCLACKHVDDVVIGAPFILTEDLIKSLNIKKVVSIKNIKEDSVLKRHQDIDPLKVAKDLGVLEEIEIEDKFYSVTTEEIA